MGQHPKIFVTKSIYVQQKGRSPDILNFDLALKISFQRLIFKCVCSFRKEGCGPKINF